MRTDILKNKHHAKKQKPSLVYAGKLLLAAPGEASIPVQRSLNPGALLKLKLPRVQKFVYIIVLTLLLGSTVFLRTSIAAELTNVYESVSQKVARTISPLPPLLAYQTRVKSSSLTQSLKQIRNQPISVSLGGSVIHPSAALIRSWVKVVNNKDSEATIQAYEANINHYLSTETASLTKQPISEVTVSHSDGTVATLQNGQNGLSFPPTNKLARQITNQLLKGNGVNASFAGLIVPFSKTNHPTVSKEIEVDTTTKRLYAYEDGVLIKTFLVTAGAPDTPTPNGTFHIWEKLPVQDMTGYNVNGTMYNQPDVQWVNYFNHSGDAIHGNYWRPLSYFGNVNSSHGCVGLVNSEAEWIYDWAPIGTTVVIHT